MKRASTIALTLATAVSAAWVATPMALIRPFGAQSPEGVAVGYAMRGWSARLTLALLSAGLLSALLLWPRLASWKGRSLAVVAVASLAVCALLGRGDYFEWIFRPLPHPVFAAAAEANGVAEDDLVLGVSAGAEARAYPVREMAYHHLVNDEIAGEPIVATY